MPNGGPLIAMLAFQEAAKTLVTHCPARLRPGAYHWHWVCKHRVCRHRVGKDSAGGLDEGLNAGVVCSHMSEIIHVLQFPGSENSPYSTSPFEKLAWRSRGPKGQKAWKQTTI